MTKTNDTSAGKEFELLFEERTVHAISSLRGYLLRLTTAEASEAGETSAELTL